jgi:hypothetical protein
LNERDVGKGMDEIYDAGYERPAVVELLLGSMKYAHHYF